MTGDPFLTAVGIIGSRELTDELLNEVIGLLPLVMPDLDEETLSRIRQQLEATIGVSMAPGQGLHGGDQLPWLEDVKASIKWNYWSAYTNQLKSTGFGQEIIRVLDEDTDNILNECGNPQKPPPWRVQGLVMGDVQSGKTASYSGLINKAADAGYRFIVLLTGTIEELRAQSQERLDEGFVGRNSRDILSGGRENKPIGAGRFRSSIPNLLTSIDSDFLSANTRALGGIPLKNINEPVLLVMKKNKSPLQNLITFLDSQLTGGAHQLTLPLLLIDDESDNASVNSKKDNDPATINRLIREILKRFGKSSYVAYTATPFANVFINPDYDDLFPKNFIYSLNAPSNYISAGSIFSESGAHRNQVVDIEDAESIFPDKHKKDLEIHGIPDSLKEALETFLLSCAARDLRAEPLKHRSMLINVTRFTDVQQRLSNVIKQYLYDLTEEIKQYLADDLIWVKHSHLVNLQNVWSKHYSGTGIEWDSVRKTLFESIASVKVLTINQKSADSDRLNYGNYKGSEKGRRVVAIGGLTLSRGLTLEGLCVSYFYRNSKAYDTLLQMGRWFGYRTGYEDLCKVWMDPDVQDWFSHIADVVSELRMDVRRMHANRQPPSKFGIRVKSHPDALIVTALNKMRNAQEVEVNVSFNEFGAETAFLPRDPLTNSNNLSRLTELVKSLDVAEPLGTRSIWRDVEAQKIVGFLRKLNISNMNMEFIPDLSGSDSPLISFIGSNGIASLQFWDVCIPQGEGTDLPDFSISCTDGTKRNVKPRNRQFEKVPEASEYLKLNKQRVGDVSDEKVGLDDTQIRAAEQEWEEARRADPDKGVTVPGYMYRRQRSRPLLTIHLIEPSDSKQGSKNERKMMKASEISSPVLVAISLSFPNFDDQQQTLVPYRLNKVALRNIGLITAQEGDDDED
jgi:hypothetical protein